MARNADELRLRAKRFAIRVLKCANGLPRTVAGATVARQLARSGSSVSANFHAACRARSRAEFVAKLGTVVEEADETVHWLDVLIEGELAAGQELFELRAEGRELGAIFRASLTTARANLQRMREVRPRTR